MVPESSANRSVDLYRCDEMPHRWTKVASLLTDVRLADATLHHDGDRWWMFATHGQPGASMYDELHLFHAADLLGPWVPHRLNPVKIDAASARPAGALFRHGRQLIRPAQDCSTVYGGGVVLNQVLRLDEQAYEECALSRLAVEGLGSAVPVHSLNAAGDTACVDALFYRPRLWPQRSNE